VGLPSSMFAVGVFPLSDVTAIFHPVSFRGAALCLPVLAGWLCLAAPLWAQGDRAAIAEALFKEGREAFDVEDYDTACARFRESDRIDPQPGTKLNLARCEKARHRIATAWAIYSLVLEVLARDDERRKVAREQVDELEPRLSKLTVTLAEGTPPDTVVTVGEVELRPDGFGTPLPVDPGPLRLLIVHPGYEPKVVQVALEEGESSSIVLSIGPAIIAPPAPPPPAPLPSGRVSDRPDLGPDAQAVAGWTMGAVGLAALLAGGATGIAGLVRKEDGEDACNDALMLCTKAGRAANDEARALLYATTGLWLAGGMAAAVGLTLVLTSEEREQPSDAEEPVAELAAHASPTAAGLSLTVRF